MVLNGAGNTPSAFLARRGTCFAQEGEEEKAGKREEKKGGDE